MYGLALALHLGNTLRAVGGDPTAVYAVGDDGLVLASSDRGASWRTIDAGTRDDLVAVWASGHEVYAVGAHSVTWSRDDGKHFQHEDLGAELYGVWGDHGTVLAVGDGGTMVSSIDHGRSWTTVALPTTACLLAIAGWTVVGDHGTVLHSDDRGASWAVEAIGTTADLVAAVGDGADVLAIDQPTDAEPLRCFRRHAGAWSIAAEHGAFDVDLPAAEDVAVVAGEPAVIVQGVEYPGMSKAIPWGALLSNHGDTALAAELLRASVPLHAIWARGHDLIAVGEAGRTLHSDDDGATWSPEEAGPIASVWGQGASVWVAGAGGLVARSHDHGRSWTREATPTQANLTVIRDGFAAGEGGVLLRRRGGRWRAIATGIGETIRDLRVRGHRLVLLADDRLLVSDDLGRTFATRAVTASAVALDGDAIWLGQEDAIARSDDGGASFATVARPAYEVSALVRDGKTWWFGVADRPDYGELDRSDDGLRSFAKTTPGHGAVVAIWAGAGHVYAVGDRGFEARDGVAQDRTPLGIGSVWSDGRDLYLVVAGTVVRRHW